MVNAKLKFSGRQLDLSKGVTTIGRASDNFVSFPDDTNISRYHAEIESREDDFYIIDLGSSNGTTVGGARVSGERLLKNGDVIVFGGTSKIEFFIEKEKPEIPLTAADGSEEQADSEEDEYIEKQEEEIAEDAEKTSKMPAAVGVAAVACGLAVVCAIGAVAYYYTRPEPKCAAQAVISRPETGDVLKTETPIEVEADNAGCVSRAVFVLDDDLVIGSTDERPFSAMIDPREFPELADGLNHSLKLILEDEEGNMIGQPSEVLLAFETLATPTPKTEIPVEPGATPRPVQPKQKEISLIETQEMAKRFVKQFSGGAEYRFNKQFLQEVQKRTAEYKADGYSQRAAQYRDVINESFIKEQNIDPPLAYFLAMSRSKFVPANQNGEEGLWLIPKELVTSNAYDGTCEDKNLTEPAQKCAAAATSVYLKTLANNIFENDVVYSAAAFGMPPLEASQWKDSLPQNRQDFWLAVKTPAQREQIIRFFAAGIVAENPQKFGLKTDAPLSELYKIAIVE